MTQNPQITIGNTTIDLVKGDITTQAVDAIVNAANSSLLGGGGVDGAIHRAAGPQLLAECRTLDGCPTGEARITRGYNLPAKHVIHAVGPIYWQEQNPAKLLGSAHEWSLRLAQEHHLKSIAFSAISTGVYGYPLDEASEVALGTVVKYIKTHQPGFELVRFVLFNDPAMQAFQETLRKMHL
ncbi:MAG: O-acetyl-ADP-ribose deacetylase [Anaerolineae bacterium]|nr:O-acetyl-ADP-ribose deacetylase [Anaerolineae bacterium]